MSGANGLAIKSYSGRVNLSFPGGKDDAYMWQVIAPYAVVHKSDLSLWFLSDKVVNSSNSNWCVKSHHV